LLKGYRAFASVGRFSHDASDLQQSDPADSFRNAVCHSEWTQDPHPPPRARSSFSTPGLTGREKQPPATMAGLVTETERRLPPSLKLRLSLKTETVNFNWQL